MSTSHSNSVVINGSDFQVTVNSVSSLSQVLEITGPPGYTRSVDITDPTIRMEMELSGGIRDDLSSSKNLA